MNINCPLCDDPSGFLCESRGRKYFCCAGCGAVFMDPQHFLPPEDEKARYLQHNNDVNDPRYQGFVRPVFEAVIESFTTDSVGLDFGCGTGPVISKLLDDRGYKVVRYDAFFLNKPELLVGPYDFIICSEVIEHFHDPAKEFDLLRSILKNRGKLFCLTERYSPEINFEEWHYKNDPTHAFFYQERTLKWIRENFRFSSLVISGRMAEFTVKK